MSVGPEEINKIAHLARLKIDEDKVEKISQDISNILSLVEQLQDADTDGIEPMAHPMDAVQILRADEVTETNKREKLQAIAPNTEDGLFLVPKVIE
jgi:aspartyl-tRNA(Asn)/glutamyl-tRNA(Gln) amidotransferase subunit C